MHKSFPELLWYVYKGTQCPAPSVFCRVLPQLMLPPECTRTHAAHVGSLTRVLAHVRFQGRPLGEGRRAYAAPVRLLSGVDPLVHDHVAGPTAGVRAEAAVVKLLPLVLDGARLTPLGCVRDGPPALEACLRIQEWRRGPWNQRCFTLVRDGDCPRIQWLVD